MGEWQDISTAPKDRMLLVWDDDTGHPDVARWNEAVGAFLIGFPDGDAVEGDPEVVGATLYGASYWQPLPPPPTKDTK